MVAKETTEEKMVVMKTFKNIFIGCLTLGILWSCAPVASPPPVEEAAYSGAPERMQAAPTPEIGKNMSTATTSGITSAALPVRFQQPSYVLEDLSSSKGLTYEDDDTYIPVGADISSTTGSVPLRDIVKRLADMKGMNVSWASDVDQWVQVDVDIRAEEDFFNAIDNLLRQTDYFQLVEGNTLVIKYKDTKVFHIAMPFLNSIYSTSIGGDVLGGGESNHDMTGKIRLQSDENSFDIWETIENNLDKILEIWEAEIQERQLAPNEKVQEGQQASPEDSAENINTNNQNRVNRSYSGKLGLGYYTIDRPVGLITVTAPKPLILKVESYVNNLTHQLYKQISIEAKIVEVVLQDNSKTGIDWSKLLQDSPFDFNITFGNINLHNPFGQNTPTNNRSLSVNAKAFSLVIDALKTQGKTTILANPKISVMNGQPAMINVGEDTAYVNKVQSKSNLGVITFTVTTDSVFSGLGLGVVATIMDNDEIIINLQPVTSQLKSITYETFGGTIGARVGLPQVKLRELNTTVRVPDGGLVVVGGLIDTEKGTTAKKIPLFGDLPLINKLFRTDTKTDIKTELIILMRPKIIS